MDISNLALALGASLTSGLNLYLTVLTLGLMDRFGFMDLPHNLKVLSNPWVLATAGILLAVEFLVDKIPYLDSTWDFIHSFIRVPAGAVIAASSFSNVPGHLLWVAALLGGFVSFTAHGAKASTRLAANAAPEPFSNTLLSLLEDAVSLILLWLIKVHPYAAVLATLLLVFFFCGLIYLFFRFFRSFFRRRASAG